MKALFKLALLLALLFIAFGGGWVAAKLGVGSVVDETSLAERERRFTAQMRDAALVGRFTIDGREDQQATPDRYDISSVEKVGENQWRFNARMPRYKTATLPIVVTMEWAADTPMITITDFTIPTLGTFTSRVLFHGDRYAGTWQHGDIGGTMFGRIEKARPGAE
jgi:uncharacterized protein (DUF1684 family)